MLGEHAADEDWLETERAEILDDLADRVEMILWVWHVTIPRGRFLAADRQKP